MVVEERRSGQGRDGIGEDSRRKLGGVEEGVSPAQDTRSTKPQSAPPDDSKTRPTQERN